jgi:aconitate hydratase
MGILPLEFTGGATAASLGLTGREVIDIAGIAEGVASGFAAGRDLTVRAASEDGSVREFAARVRLDTEQEVQYYRHGGILHFVLRQLLGRAA